jgi:hypothetical protein
MIKNTIIPLAIAMNHGFLKTSIAILIDRLKCVPIKQYKKFDELHIINYNMNAGPNIALGDRIAKGI